MRPIKAYHATDKSVTMSIKENGFTFSPMHIMKSHIMSVPGSESCMTSTFSDILPDTVAKVSITLPPSSPSAGTRNFSRGLLIHAIFPDVMSSVICDHYH